MASTYLRQDAFSTPDIGQAVERIERERNMKVAGVFGGLVLLIAGLLSVAYLNFGQTFDPGPPRDDSNTPAHYGEVGPLAGPQRARTRVTAVERRAT